MYLSQSGSETSESTLMNNEPEDEVLENNDAEQYSIESYNYTYDATRANADIRALYRILLSGLVIEPEEQDNLIDEDDDYYNNYDVDDYYQIQRVYEIEYLFLDSEKVHNKYYIGIYSIHEYVTPQSTTHAEIILGCCVSPATFFEFPIKTVEYYLSMHSINYNDRFSKKNVDILKLCINEIDGTYNVIVKTSWLRMIQRKWKKIYAEKKRDIEHRMKLSSMRYFEVYGKWPPKYSII